MTISPLAAGIRLAPLLLGVQPARRLSILIYHRVLPEPDPLRPDEPTVREFDWQMRLLRQHFRPLPLLEAVARMQAGSLPERAVCVTFDDGYADNAQCALPVLQRHAVPATVFVSTGFLNGGRMWNDTVIESVRGCTAQQLDLRDLGLGSLPLRTVADRLAAIDRILAAIKHLAPNVRAQHVDRLAALAPALPRDLMMSDAQVCELASAGVTIGAHTVSHPILASLCGDEARSEIAASREYLQQLLQKEVAVFAYPNGKPGTDYRPEHRDMVAELGFRVALSTHWGAGAVDSDPLQLPRFTPWDKRPWPFALRLLANLRRGDALAASGG